MFVKSSGRVFVCSLVSLVFASPWVRAGDGPSPKAADKAESPAAKALKAPVGEIEFKRIAFQKTIAELSKRAHVCISVDWKALDAAKIAGDVAIELHLNDSTLGEALCMILRSASRSREALDYEVGDSAITISTKTAFANRPTVHVYNCASLMPGQLSKEQRQHLDESVARLWKQHYAVFGPPWRSLSERASRSYLGLRRESAELLAELDAALRARRIEEIAASIRNGIDPASWRESDGFATLTVVGDKLVVSQSPANHRAIVELLGQLKNAAN